MKKIISLSVLALFLALSANVTYASSSWRGCNGDGTHGIFQQGAAFGSGLANANSNSAVWQCQ